VFKIILSGIYLTWIKAVDFIARSVFVISTPKDESEVVPGASGVPVSVIGNNSRQHVPHGRQQCPAVRNFRTNLKKNQFTILMTVLVYTNIHCIYK